MEKKDLTFNASNVEPNELLSYRDEILTFQIGDIVPNTISSFRGDIQRFSFYSMDEDSFNHVLNSSIKQDALMAGGRGIVSLAYHAFCGHHNLVLTPDDFWSTIITQFSFYVNKYSELLQSKFTTFKGKRNFSIPISPVSDLSDLDHAYIIKTFVDDLNVLLKDDIKSWLVPSFSTTTETDKLFASIVMLASMKDYLILCCSPVCGIPNITLKGTTQDWEELRSKISLLEKYNLDTCEDYQETVKLACISRDDVDLKTLLLRKDIKDNPRLMTKWVQLLNPLVDKLIETSKGNIDVKWWKSMINEKGCGSGSRTILGWISAFIPFDIYGNWCSESQPEGWPLYKKENLPSTMVEVPIYMGGYGHLHLYKFIAGSMSVTAVDKFTLSQNRDWAVVKICECKDTRWACTHKTQ